MRCRSFYIPPSTFLFPLSTFHFPLSPFLPPSTILLPPSSFHFPHFSHSNATGGAQGSENRGDDACNHLQSNLPSFFVLHGLSRFLMVNTGREPRSSQLPPLINSQDPRCRYRLRLGSPLPRKGWGWGPGCRQCSPARPPRFHRQLR